MTVPTWFAIAVASVNCAAWFWGYTLGIRHGRRSR